MIHRHRYPTALALAFAILASGCRPREKTAAAAVSKDEAVPVRLASVERGAVKRVVHVPATVVAKSQITLSFKAPGVLAAVDVEEGAHVRRGQVVARVTATEYASSVAVQSETLAKAERDLARARALYDSASSPKSDLDNAATQVAVARANLEAARFHAQHTSLVAPDDCVVLGRSAEPGEMVAAGRPIVSLQCRGRGFVVRGYVAGKVALALAIGDPATVVIDDRRSAPIAGTISEIGAAQTGRTGMYLVEVRLPPDVAVLSGLSAKIELTLDEGARAVVPAASVILDSAGRSSVLVRDGAKQGVRPIPVRVLYFDGDKAALGDDLEGSSEVVGDGASLAVGAAQIRFVR